ncbi:hypothetical protein ACRALDRAFT_1074298 [Sodiomyces alcalophilus JCM 7366]|uniref:uncharacterized protein n=1 Tax=Sodiomyces alcalophilus JCM 7366 TaxID=591952 RepID=UPI0039B6215A
MAQSQPQMPQRHLSPPQSSPSPAPNQQGFALPPTKRPRLSPAPPSQPQSPYTGSPYAISPSVPIAPSNVGTSTASPTLPGVQAPTGQYPAAYTTPYTNGNTTPHLALPENRATPPPPPLPTSTPQPQSIAAPLPGHPPGPLTAPALPYTNATFGPAIPTIATPPPQYQQLQPVQPMQPQSAAQGAMGPPSKPPERTQKEYEYDVTDSLAGTGIDLRAEEQFLSELYAVDPTVPESRTGFAIHPPGNRASFYGAGSANQPAQPIDGKSQNQVIAETAEKAWQESARRLAASRAVELKNAFLNVPIVQARAEAVAKEYGLGLNWDMKANQGMGRMKIMEENPRPVKVSTRIGPDGALIRTTGTWIPQDAYLADQLALLSIATKQRLRTLMEDSDRIAVTRQTSSHGEVPEHWKVAAAPLKPVIPGSEAATEAPRTGEESAVSPRTTNPLKRPHDDKANPGASGPRTKALKGANTTPITMSAMMREIARAEREREEARLRRRNARKEGTAEGGSTTSRAGSAAPGTPASTAGDGEKTITKKEQKRLDAMKKAEASSHANQNLTSREFLGMTRPGGLFGKKGGKSYSWMTGGGSGASTPKGGLPGKGGTPSANSPAPGPAALTADGSSHRRPGAWREDKEKGKDIQLRDWVAALEADGLEVEALQRAYMKLDTAWPKQ